MAYTTIDNPTDYFNTVLYTGNGSTQTITGVGFQPDWVWTKGRGDTYSHMLYDSVRGATKELNSHLADAETTVTNSLTSFNSDGFTLGSFGESNDNSQNYVAWNWKETATAGFDIVSYTGNDTARTISHSLSAVPNMIIIKDRDAGNDWFIYHSGNTSAPETDYIKLNSTAATADLNTLWNDTAPTSSVFTIGTNGNINTTGNDYIAYCFAEKKGYSKFGSYTGTGSVRTYVYTGFKPAFVLHKRTDATNNWHIVDNKRDTFNPFDINLYANLSNAEYAETDGMDFLSNGFRARENSTWINASGGTYIYMAFAENPFVTSKGIPTTAR